MDRSDLGTASTQAAAVSQRSWRPAASFAGQVLRIEGFVERDCGPALRSELPSCAIPLIVVLGQGFTLHEEKGAQSLRRLDRPFVAGLHRAPAKVGSSGRSSCIQVDLTPLGARRLLGIAMSELADLVVDLDALDGMASDLQAQLVEAADWQARFRRLERFLLQRLLPVEADDRRVALACRLLQAATPPIGIAALCRQLNVSRKHLNSLFLRDVGCPPKRFQRTARFTRAAAALRGETPFSTLADLAISCGYADQSHFNRDFKAFSGVTPRELLAAAGPAGQR
ncbi:MAG: helix-turn-helix domain-containing protein [Rhodospirillales bacterium]